MKMKLLVSLWMILWTTMLSFTFIHCTDVIHRFDRNNIIDDDQIYHHDDDEKIEIISSMVRTISDQHHQLANDQHMGKSLLHEKKDDDNMKKHRIHNGNVESLNNRFKSMNHHHHHRILTTNGGDDRLSFQNSPIHHHSANNNRNVHDDIVVHRENFYDNGFNHKSHDDIMLTGDDRLLQSLQQQQVSSTIVDECVYNESDIRFAISNAPIFSNNISTKINLCSSHIFINASSTIITNNNIGDRNHGILIENKNLEFHCTIVANNNMTHNNNCIIDMQSLSRLFYIINSTIMFNNIDFINGNGYIENLYSNGGVFYVELSSIHMIHCGFSNNTAIVGGGMYILDSIVKMMMKSISDDNNTTTIRSVVAVVIQNNLAYSDGGFIIALNSMIDINQYNFVNNTSYVTGGAISIFNSTLKLSGNDNNNNNNPTLLLSIIQNNIANEIGGFLYAYNSIIEINNYKMINNIATMLAGGALYLSNCTTILENISFENNFATWGGGAVMVDNLSAYGERSTLFMINVLLTNNTSLERKDSILIVDTKISLNKVSFSKSPYIGDSYDLVVANFNTDDSDYRESFINLPSSPPPQTKKPVPQQTCITNGNDLIVAVNNCDEIALEKSCDIDICGGRLQMNTSTNGNGINISNKNIILNCQRICPTKQCILDGLGLSRMFYGSSYTFKVQNIIFLNGFHPNEGGSIRGDSDSMITIINCSFVNNTAPFGSAVIVNNSKLTIEGMETNFVNNTGVGPPIQVLSSQLNISNAICAGNNASKYDAAILMYNSTIEVSDFHFLRSTTIKQQRDLTSDANVFVSCDVYVSVYADDFSNKFSCMDLEKTNKSFPVIDVSDGCPTSSPVTASPTMPPSASPTSVSAMPSPLSTTTKTYPPVPATSPVPPPSHTICFSGENLVEVKDIGFIPMRDIKIGDFVKSANDVYTQIYGFGHLDHDQEATYLRLSFNSNDKNHVSYIVASRLEISPKHLVFVNNSNNKQGFIRASDVVVGDILSGEKVKSIETVVRRGVYAPLTQSGDIIVSDILASNYVDILDYNVPMNQHTWGHFMFTSQRWFCYYYMDTCKKEIYINGYGILAYFIVVMSSIINGFQSIVRICVRF